ncbi:helix-turn-helix domain-containing protein [Arthrobacter sp. 2RAF6]|uniref:helix-turn-helix domain-containing protein n=1 Tax=Arthrobacter sp. 2RAF6 TaxID=3233002 RepID=UPI003F92D3B3
MPCTSAETAEQWSSACSQAFVPLKVRSASVGFTASLEQAQLPRNVSIAKVVSEASEVYRSHDLVRMHERDDMLLSLQRSGVGNILQHGRSAPLQRGQAAMYDASSPYSLQFPSKMSEMVLQVPRSVVPLTGLAFEGLTARVLPPSASLTVLTSLLCSLDPKEAEIGSEIAAEHLADATVSLLKAVLVSTSIAGRPEVDASILHVAFCGYVNQHFSESDLGVERIAGAHHVSVRLVHKVFAAEGDTPAGFIRRVRLGHARFLLRDGHSVTGVAYRVGFSNPDTFTRAYKRHFGLLPSEDSRL